MSRFKKIGLILWKNWLFRRRHYIMTALEIVFPTFFAVAVFMIRKLGGPQFQVEYYPEFTEVEPETFQRISYYNDHENQRTYLLYYPNTDVAKDLLIYINNYTDGKLIFEGVDSEANINIMATKLKILKDKLFGAVVFEGLNEKGDLFTDKLKYKIRLAGNWHTNELEKIIIRPGPPYYHNDKYSHSELSQFLTLQHAIATRVIEKKKKKSDLLNKYMIKLGPFPYPPYHDDRGFSVVMTTILPLFITLSYIFTAPITVRRIVREKEIGIKELMKLMGISKGVQWFGWFISSFIIMALSAIIIVALLCSKSNKGTTVLDKSAPELIFVIFLFYIISVICFCFFITSLFSKPTLAAGITVLMWIISFCVPYYSLFQRYTYLHYSYKLQLALIPNMAMAWAIRIMAGFEAQSVGIQWSNLNETNIGDNISMLQVILMMITNSFVYIILTWYIDNVFPGVYGVPKPWYFLFTKSYWKGEQMTEIDKTTDSVFNAEKFEEEPTGLETSIVIKNLSKSYGWKSQSPALNDLCLNIYQGQITALLGHNGAGKTTTMSILTGMFPPSKGTAYVNGYDIRTNIDKARNDLGLCPQYNMLFDKLTVEEHLIFFGKLKIESSQELKTEVSELIKKLQLFTKRHTFAMNLSGGMKRKLNLGIALIGSPKVVMLDEPTSGMDPEARRAIWDLLKEFRIGRCILLSTHFMEEADVLGDRIAIMAAGKLECCGSPMFLKNHYGAGYHLTVSLNTHLHTNEIRNIVESHVTSSSVEESSDTQMTYLLPSDKTAFFPNLFENLEFDSNSLDIKAFGLSVTTMEEVFLKVGSESVPEEEDTDSTVILLKNGSASENIGLFPKSKIARKIQQFYGLILKRFYYAYHRPFLIAVQIFLPLITILLVIYLNNELETLYENRQPPRLMDLSDYKHCFGFFHKNPETDNAIVDAFRSSFPSKCTVRNESDPQMYLRDIGVNDFLFYRDKLLLGAEFSSTEENYKILIWINNHFYHTLPTALNLVHNAILKHDTPNEQISLLVENSPLKEFGETFRIDDESIRVARSTVMGVFMPIGLSMLAASFIVFIIHERVSKCKHIQFMTGVGGTTFWIASFVWDFAICILACIFSAILFAVVDKTRIFNSKNIAIVFFLLFLYCWASIPFTYLISFLFQFPASGFTCLNIINIASGIIFSFWMFIKELGGERSGLRCLFSFVPNYSGTVAFMKLVYVADLNSICAKKPAQLLELLCKEEKNHELKKCCVDSCGSNCFKSIDYFTSEWPGLGYELKMLTLDGLLYFVIICLLESSCFYTLRHYLNRLFTRFKRRNKSVVISSIDTLDNDVLVESERVHNMTSQEDYLVVRDLTKYFGNFTAVDGLNFGVENGTCFGLLGINGAGKTTTFRQLTGDLLIDSGDAFIQEFSITKNKSKYLENIGYCPQFDALIDHLTGREILSVFANLHGINRSQIKKIVNKTIDNFDLTNHANKLVLACSGGNKRKLSAALAFMGRPAAVFLDEPTTGVDPTARRKIWNMIKNTNNAGTAIVLTSHSMEECEVLCSRIGIMVNGQFQCFGGIQYLKNRFSQGFTILAKIKEQPTTEGVIQTNQTELQEFIEKKFPTAELKDVHQGLVQYQIADPNTKLTDLFIAMEQAKNRFHLEDYSVTQATLEELFLSFARKQRIGLQK